MAKRDYRAEYRRRRARGLSRGLTLSQARGHPRSGERHVRARPVVYDQKLERGVNTLRQGKTLSKVARQLHVSPERLRSYAKSLSFVEKRKGRYVVGEDLRLRRVEFLADGRRVIATVRGYAPAELAGSYWDAVPRYLATHDPAFLKPFVGKQITDTRGKTYTLETRPNVLHRLWNEGGEPFEQIYRVAV